MEESLYRAGLEALNNVLRHATADSVAIRIQASKYLVEMEIVDDGHGFDPGAVREGGGMGLTTMQERAEQVGGTLEIRSLPDEGTTVKIAVPTRVLGSRQHTGKVPR